METIADACGVVQQQYDQQLHFAMSKMSSAGANMQLQNCVTASHRWFAENVLALNPDKSEAALVLKARCAKGIPAISNEAAGSMIVLSNKIKLLCVMLDGNLNFNDQNVQNISRSCAASYLSFFEEMANVFT